MERESFLDKLRVAATCAVVLLHTMTGVMDTTDMSLFSLENKVFLVALDFVCWCVPVFVLISGYLFLNPARKITMRDMLAKYCRRVALALFLFGVPYACLEQAALEHTFKTGMLGKGFLMVLQGKSWSHMWYLYQILLLYLITPVVKWLLEQVPRPVVYVFLGVLAAASSILPCLAKLLGWEYPEALLGIYVYLFYYLCGYLFAVSGNAAKAREGGGEACVWMLPGAAAAIALATAAARLSGIRTGRTAYNDPLTVLLALLVFGSGLAWSRNGKKNMGEKAKKDVGKNVEKSAKNTGFWGQASALTFAVYLVHPVFLNFFYKFLHITPLDFDIRASLPLFFSGTLLASFATAWALRRIPVLRKYVL